MTDMEFLQGSLAADVRSLDDLRNLGPDGVLRAVSAARTPFSFALRWPDGTAIAAVDRFAIHSACYRQAGTTIAFAPRADALGAGAAEIDPQALLDYLYFHVIPSPGTVFRDVHRIPPGHLGRWRDGRFELQRYWTPSFTEPARSAVSYDALRDEFRQCLRQAVGSRLDPEHPACFLSGGTDSSTVAGLIAELAGGRCDTYSIGFEAEGYDEMAFARIAAKHFGTRHHEYYCTPDDLVRSIGAVAASYDQPFGNSSSLPAYYCALQAHGDGVRRLLAGDGGDELFGGNKRYATQRVFGYFDRLPSALRGLSEGVLLGTPVGRLPLLRKGASYVRQARVPLPDRLETYNLLERLGPRDLLTPAFLAQVDLDGPARQQRTVWAELKTGDVLNQQLAFDWRYTLAENDLPKVCGTTALAGVDVAFPMLDHALVDFSTRLPVDYKLKGLTLRWFFKDALRGFLPDEIITKKKQGFGLPFGVWAVRHAGLAALARDSLSSFGTRGVIQPAFLQTLLDRHLPEHPGYYGEMVWIVMMLEQWLQRHAPSFRT